MSQSDKKPALHYSGGRHIDVSATDENEFGHRNATIAFVVLAISFAVAVVGLFLYTNGIGTASSSGYAAVADDTTIAVDVSDLTGAEENNRAIEADYRNGLTVNKATKVKLPVKGIDQMGDPTDPASKAYSNGCEITSLAMVFNYAGLDVTKEDVAAAMNYTVFYDAKTGTWGNPDEGFVGSLEGNTEGGYGVYHGPVLRTSYELIRDASADLVAVDLTGSTFDDVLLETALGHPVWVITTTSFEPTENWEQWQTNDGVKLINWNLHSVVVAGFDEKYVYLVDPYGAGEAQADRAAFQAAWESMGRQAIVVHKPYNGQEL